MKLNPIITVLIASSTIAWAEDAAEQKPEAEGKTPWNKPIAGEVEIIRPIGRIQVAEREDRAIQPETEAIPKKYAEEKAVAIKLEDLKPVGERLVMRAVLRIINPTDQAITFTGFSEKSPITKVEHWKDGKWVDERKVLRCGTGLRQCIIGPGQSAVFEEAVYAETMPTRIGISYSQFVALEGSPPRNAVIWSEKIER